jgi:hypothetical protein
MDAIACVTQILEEAGNEIEEKDDHRVVFLSRSMKTRVCMIVADGFAHARLLVIIAFQPIDSESLARIHRHIAEAENDMSRLLAGSNKSRTKPAGGLISHSQVISMQTKKCSSAYSPTHTTT